MKFHLLFALLFVTACFADEVSEDEDTFEQEMGIMDDPVQKGKDEDNLKKAEDEINEENKKFDNGEATFKEKLNPLSVMDKDELEKEKEGANMPDSDDDMRSFTGNRVNGIIMPPASERTNPESEAFFANFYSKMNRQTLRQSVDSVAAGLVTDVKNQQSCGSCAAFGATALHETCMLKAGAPKSGLDLSEQHLVDCGFNSGSMNGCNGAWPHAYQAWFKKQGGAAPHEIKYPYLDRNPKLTCPSDITKWNSGAKVDDVKWDYSCDASKMKALVDQYGAVGAALYASSFSNFATGVFSGCKSKKINHAVVVVGYGTENGNDYWLAKNSWGKTWGDKGFIKIKRGTNECGIEGICVVAQCSKSGTAEPAPVAPPKPPVPAALTCDISSLFGSSDITGTYTLRVWGSSGTIVSSVKCTKSVCTPKMPGPSNACIYICGKQTC